MTDPEEALRAIEDRDGLTREQLESTFRAIEERGREPHRHAIYASAWGDEFVTCVECGLPLKKVTSYRELSLDELSLDELSQ